MKTRPPYHGMIPIPGITPKPHDITCPKCGEPGWRYDTDKLDEYYNCGASTFKGKFQDHEGCCYFARKINGLRHRIKQLEHEVKRLKDFKKANKIMSSMLVSKTMKRMRNLYGTL